MFPLLWHKAAGCFVGTIIDRRLHAPHVDFRAVLGAAEQFRSGVGRTATLRRAQFVCHAADHRLVQHQRRADDRRLAARHRPDVVRARSGTVGVWNGPRTDAVCRRTAAANDVAKAEVWTDGNSRSRSVDLIGKKHN